jgi:folate-dependent phosphoribosylglycinamide formyltransferase PurN
VVRATLEQKVGFTVGLVVCNNGPDKVPGLYAKFSELNREFGLTGDSRVDVVNIGPRTHPDGKLQRGQTLSESAAVCRMLEERDTGFVATLGYLRIITGELLEAGGWKPEYGAADTTFNGIYHHGAWILNNHPAILPFTADTHGSGAHARALALYRAGKLRSTAFTQHLVGVGVDNGPVVHQEPVPIYDTDDVDSLSARVQTTEKAMTAHVIEKHLILRDEHLRGGL